MARLFKPPHSRYWYIDDRGQHGTGRRWSTGVESKQLAEQLLAEHIRRRVLNRAGVEGAPLRTKDFLADLERRLGVSGASSRCIRNDVARVRRFLEAAGKPPSLIEAADIERFRDARLEVVSPATVRRDMDAINAALRHAVRQGWLTKDPTVTVARPRQVKRIISWLEAEQITRLMLAAADWRGGELHAAIAVAAYAGLRQAEIRYLDWSDIDLRRRRLTVRAKVDFDKVPLSLDEARSLTPAQIRKRFKPEDLGDWIFLPKDREERALPINGPLSEVLAAAADREGRGEHLLNGPGGGRRGRTYMKQSIDALRAELRRPYEEAGEQAPAWIGTTGWQILRHSFASHLVMAGVSIFQVSRLLGHSSVRVTESNYAHLAPDKLGAELDRLDY